MQGYAQEICRTRFIVRLRIEVDAPGVLAAIRMSYAPDSNPKPNPNCKPNPKTQL